ncbi:MAG: cytochrome P450 [Oligoflexus sp.]|nr:cytochrome P450 [Oligoflexus sp.]
MSMSSAGSVSTKPVPLSETLTWRDLYEFYTDVQSSIAWRVKRYGRIYSWKPIRRVVMMLGADANQFVLVQNPKLFSAQQAWYESIGILFKGGLLNRDGSDHRQHRRLLMPVFRQQAINFYLEQAEPIIAQHLKAWPKDCPDIYLLVKELTLHIAIRSFFGIEDPKEIKLYNRYLSEIVAGSIAFIKAPVIGKTYQRALRARRELIKLLRPLVLKRRSEPTGDMVGQLCQSIDESGNILSDEEIIDQMLFIIMAAHDTTASTLASLFYELALNPEWQEILHEESQAVTAKKLSVSELPDSLESHHLVIKETLRKNTPLKLIPRVNLEAFTFEGYLLEAGQLISTCPAYSHFMEEYWTKPLQFDPLRFHADRAEHKTHPYAFMPFGGGVHTCIGQFFAEKILSVILHHIVSRYRWTVPNVETQKFQQVPIQVPKKRLPVELIRR